MKVYQTSTSGKRPSHYLTCNSDSLNQFFFFLKKEVVPDFFCLQGVVLGAQRT